MRGAWLVTLAFAGCSFRSSTAGNDMVHDAPLDHDMIDAPAGFACVGAGNYGICVSPDIPAATNPTGTIDTDHSNLCLPSTMWTWSKSQPDSCVIAAGTITVDAEATGSRPLVIVGTADVTVTRLDVSSVHGGRTGPGHDPTACTAPTAPGNQAGGAGGTFRTRGGSGGNHDGDAGGIAAFVSVDLPVQLQGGCGGANGDSGGTDGVGGAGGGVVYVASGTSLAVAAIGASGAGGSHSSNQGGGAGGGSGGMIVLYAPVIVATAVTVSANGGGGAAGSENANVGQDGNDPMMAMPQTPARGGAPATGAGVRGGDGFAGPTAAEAGVNGGGNNGGGGGGGGGGLIQSNIGFGTTSPPITTL